MYVYICLHGVLQYTDCWVTAVCLNCIPHYGPTELRKLLIMNARG